MTHTAAQPIEHAMQSATMWLGDIAARLGTDDEEFSYRVTRAWLHAVRDRLPVVDAAHLAAQLPALLRGVYYEGWNPSHVPIKTHVDEFVARFAAEARISAADVPGIASAVTDALDQRLTNLGKVLDRAPAAVRHVLRPEELTAHVGRHVQPDGPVGS